jgi:preprotein translocase subunit YajC
MLINMMILAETAAPVASGQPGSGQFWGMMAIMAALFYFAIIRPQRRQAKERKEMMSTLKAGDRVLMASGILGTISSVKEHTVTVKISDSVKVEALRSSISRVLADDTQLGTIDEAK